MKSKQLRVTWFGLRGMPICMYTDGSFCRLYHHRGSNGQAAGLTIGSGSHYGCKYRLIVMCFSLLGRYKNKLHFDPILRYRIAGAGERDKAFSFSLSLYILTFTHPHKPNISQTLPSNLGSWLPVPTMMTAISRYRRRRQSEQRHPFHGRVKEKPARDHPQTFQWI